MRWGFWPSTVDSPVCCVLLCIPLHHLLFLSALPLKTAHCSAQLFLLYMEVYTISEKKGGAQLEPYRRKTRIHIYSAVCVCVCILYICVCVRVERLVVSIKASRVAGALHQRTEGRRSGSKSLQHPPTSSRNHLSTIFQFVRQETRIANLFCFDFWLRSPANFIFLEKWPKLPKAIYCDVSFFSISAIRRTDWITSDSFFKSHLPNLVDKQFNRSSDNLTQRAVHNIHQVYMKS